MCRKPVALKEHRPGKTKLDVSAINMFNVPNNGPQKKQARTKMLFEGVQIDYINFYQFHSGSDQVFFNNSL